jgi:hypothetical protein
MSNFKVKQMGDSNWAVFLENPNDDKDRYMLTSPLDSKSEAEYFRREFERIASIQESIPTKRVRRTFLDDDDYLE